jgi:hypothetical protein
LQQRPAGVATWTTIFRSDDPLGAFRFQRAGADRCASAGRILECPMPLSRPIPGTPSLTNIAVTDRESGVTADFWVRGAGASLRHDIFLKLT